MKVFRLILLIATSLMLLLSIVGWLTSHFKMHRFLVRAGDSQFALVIAAGDVMVGTVDMRVYQLQPGFTHESQDVERYAYEFLQANTTFGFGATASREWRGIYIPFWFVSLFWAAIAGLLVWRVIAARRRKLSPAFPVDLAGDSA